MKWDESIQSRFTLFHQSIKCAFILKQVSVIVLMGRKYFMNQALIPAFLTFKDKFLARSKSNNPSIHFGHS
jgi:hypothetical protein